MENMEICASALAALLLSALLCACDSRPRTTSIFGAAVNEDFVFAKKWVDQGGDPNEIDDIGVSLFHRLFDPNVPSKSILWFLGNGADPDAPTTVTRWTPLMLAANDVRLDVCQALLKKGANPHARNSDGLTALEVVGQTNGSTVELKIKAILRAAIAR